jgi:glucose/arabinose dehydrogenase
MTQIRQLVCAGMLACAGLCAIGCGSTAKLPVADGTGPRPVLPPPEKSLLPTVNVVTAKGWTENLAPTGPEGTTVSAFARDLDHPRWLYVLPNGDVLVAETNAPARPEDNKGLKGDFFKRFQQKAGGAVPSANRITLLRDADGDGVAETRSVFLENLNSPFGMVLVDGSLYVAETDELTVFPYHEGDTKITAPGVMLVPLPAGSINHHWTKNVIASDDGSKLYVTVGSNSNIAENGFDQEEGRAAIWEVDRKTGMHRVFASGLRNPNGMAWVNGELWTAVNERDELGGDLAPDYMTSVHLNDFFGWPYSYWGSHVDDRVKPQRADLVDLAREPDYALGPHTASLGLVSSEGTTLPPQFREGLFVGQHGSWNRKPRSGYKVIFVPFTEGRPSGDPIDVLTGFVKGDDAFGRPVGVVIDRRGSLLVADDVGNVVWRVAAVNGGR